jgi:aminoglycoside phosphotransferase family enzyme
VSPAVLDFLTRPDSYPDRPPTVEVVETHFAWVFLSRELVYKLKKPIRFRGLDLTTIAARRANCELEVALNRRLSDGVYVGVTPLGLRGSEVVLDGPGAPIEWLVKMRRLPAERTLDRVARDSTIRDADLTRLVDRLCSYYERAERAPWTPAEYRRALLLRSAQYGAELRALALGPGVAARVHALTAAQSRFIELHAEHLEGRMASGRVVDAHGDLRPEHVFLGDPIQIIDCLEFSSELRLLDSAEEVAFLALELARLGQAAVGQRIIDLYRRRGSDLAQPELLGFYRSSRALVRAVLAALHVADTPSAVRERWRTNAAWYLDEALAAISAPPGRNPLG